MAPGLGAIRAWIWLFSSTQDQCLVGRIEIEPDDVFHLRGKILIARDFESLTRCGLIPCMPYQLDTAIGHAACRSHTAHTPVRRIRRLLMHRHVHHLLIFSGSKGSRATAGLRRSAGQAAAPVVHRKQALANCRYNPLSPSAFAGQQQAVPTKPAVPTKCARSSSSA